METTVVEAQEYKIVKEKRNTDFKRHGMISGSPHRSDWTLTRRKKWWGRLIFWRNNGWEVSIKDMQVTDLKKKKADITS